MALSNLRSLAVSETRTLTKSFSHFAADIKLAHSVFALPFAASAFVFGDIQLPDIRKIVLLLTCMVTARTTAMGMNRFLDRHLDLSNPRTRMRKIPSGQITAFQGLFWSLCSGVLFVIAAAHLSELAAYLAVPLLMLLVAYSWMKRLTWLTHWYLGFCLGLAPMAVEIALKGRLSLPVFFVGLAVTLWTGGFDILYSLQDMDFDRKLGLRSVPSKFGSSKAITFSRLSFAAMILMLLLAGQSAGRGLLYWIGVFVIGVILTTEHWLVRDAKESGTSPHLGVAFFNLNAWVSVVFFGFSLLDAWKHI